MRQYISKRLKLIILLIVLIVIISVAFIAKDIMTKNLVNKDLQLGVFFVNGEQTDSPYSNNREQSFPTKGQTTVEQQSKIIYLKPKKTSKPNLVLVPGFGLTSDLYLTTPDQRQGWAQMFYRDGFPVYLITPPERSGYVDINAINACLIGQKKVYDCDSYIASIGKTTLQAPWQTWGFGPKYGVAFKDSKFPAFPLDKNYIGQFGASLVVYQGKSNIDITEAEEMNQASEDALIALLKKIGPSVLIIHSAAGASGYKLAEDHPELVKGIVAIETTMCPENGASGKSPLGKIPFLGIWGDHIEERGKAGNHPQRYLSCKKMAEAIQKQGNAPARFISLPEDLRTYGNSHIMMQDTNNSQIEKIIVKWLNNNRIILNTK